MPYRHIRSLIHNWSHSFVSLMNYVDGGYVIDDLGALLARDEVDEITVNPLKRSVSPSAAQTQRILKSLDYWSDALSSQMAAQNVQPHELASFELRISRPFRCIALATDDRGKQYEINVVPT
jgi:hypothetical protein